MKKILKVLIINIHFCDFCVKTFQSLREMGFKTRPILYFLILQI